MKLKILTNEEVYNCPTSLAQSIVSMYGRLDLSNRKWFVIFDDNHEWCAYGGYRQIDQQSVYFGPTHVLEKFRGKGLQRKLIRARIKVAKEDGYGQAISSIYTYNFISGNNLIACGFRMCRIPQYYDAIDSEVWMFKKI